MLDSPKLSASPASASGRRPGLEADSAPKDVPIPLDDDNKGTSEAIETDVSLGIARNVSVSDESRVLSRDLESSAGILSPRSRRCKESLQKSHSCLQL